MTNFQKKSQGQHRFQALQTPNPISNNDTMTKRRTWLTNVESTFVCPSKANKEYYMVALKTLWPEHHGIPGPHIKEVQIRTSINAFRNKTKKGKSPYVDVFRRIRELQGEEGVTGIARKGRLFQLVSLELSPKRIPRTKLSDFNWNAIKLAYGFKCSICCRAEPEVLLNQDHKIPRLRGGGTNLNNWQPLCNECNNFKSVSCRGCNLDCNKCPWAFPETYPFLRLPDSLRESFFDFCKSQNKNPNEVLSALILIHLKKKVSNE